MIKSATYNIFVLAATGLVNSKHHALSILGLTENPSLDDIKKAYKIKSKELHPDLNPNASQLEMKMLNAARDFLLSTQNEEVVPKAPITEVQEDDFYPSYEEIAQERRDLGRDEFAKKYPGWEGELKGEMGLDEYNRIFEGYDPNYNPYNDRGDSDQDNLYEYAGDYASDAAYELFEKAKEDKNLDIYTKSHDLIDKYPEIVKPPDFYKNKNKQKLFAKFYDELLSEKFSELILDNIDDFDLTLDYVLDFPNHKVVTSFFSRGDNVEKFTVPDSSLNNKIFIMSIFHMLIKPECFFFAKKFFNKYRDNNNFINGIMKCTGFLYWFKENEKAKELIKSLPFNDEQKYVVNRWLDYK